MKNTALYIHIPFCVSKCRYCDFTSYVVDEEIKDTYIKSLIKELLIYSEDESINITTVYIGGGTPSLLHSRHIEAITNSIYSSFNTNIEEFTIECNPDSINEEKLIAYKQLGINRISMGVQTFNDNILKFLGRPHNSEDAHRAIRLIKKHYDNYNVDLMIGLPTETEEDVINTINQLLYYDIPHISLYSLIIEEGTPIEKDYQDMKFFLAEEDTIVDRFNKAVEMMSKININRYEISNFAKSGYQCRHNLAYWNLVDYIGIGVSAHGYLNRIRFANTSNLSDYNVSLSIDKKPLVEINRMNERETEFEYIMLGLRLTRGLKLSDYTTLFNKDFKIIYSNQLDELADYLLINDNYVSVRPEFLGVLNSILLKFM